MDKIFVKQDRKPQQGYDMRTVLGRKVTKGEVGIEIEVEGNKFPKPPGCEMTHHPVKLPGSKFWSYVHDGSLRGNDNAEYLLTVPVDFDKVGDAITEIYGALATYGSVIDDSNRTSVHIHLNCQEFHLNRLTSLMALWFTFEEILTAWCGEHRVGNLFCLRAKDAPAIIAQLRKFIKYDGQVQLSEGLHYAGMNAHALMKYGSIEIRTLRGCTDPSTVLDWTGIIERLYKRSEEFQDPRDICSLFSSEGPLAFFESILGDKTSVVRNAVNYTDDQVRDAMYEGVRFAQDLCYCRDWSVFKPVLLKPDPFNRDLKKVAKKLQAQPVPTAPVAVNEWAEPEPEYDPDSDLDAMIELSQNTAQPASTASQTISAAQLMSDYWSNS